MKPLECAGVLVAVVCATALSMTVSVGVAQTAAPPTFNQDVAPILFANCVACHRPGEVAPMSLLSYEEATPWARAIKIKVLSREMPPWPADPQYGRFRNERTLTAAQIDTLVSWVDAGAPRGDGVPPPPPTFLEGWTSQMDRPPDLVIDWPSEFEIPATGVLPSFTLWMKLPFRDDTFVEAVELRPTNRAVVHHEAVFLARLPRGAKVAKSEAYPGGPVLDGVPVSRDGTRAPLSRPLEEFYKPLVFYVPAGGFLRFPSGVAKRIRPDDYLMWDFHFMPSGQVQRTSARLGLWFSRSKVHHEALMWTVHEQLAVNGKDVPLDAIGRPQFPSIAPHQEQYTVTAVMKVTDDLTLYALWPHMHLRGRAMTFVLVDRDGREQTLLSVPRYNFNWQITYELATPLKIRAGSTIKVIAQYDNSRANRNNPDPNQEVVWGQQTTNEMFDPYLELAYDKGTFQQAPAQISRPGCERQPLDPADPVPSVGLLPSPCF